MSISYAQRPEVSGLGECAFLPDLSCDALPDYENILRKACEDLEASGCLDYNKLKPYPSILFGLETALAQLEAEGEVSFFDTPFSRGEEGIPINGLIWMGSYQEMFSRIEEKLKQGFSCLKLKVGAIDFEEELALLRHIRSRFDKSDLELRIDANGGFSAEDALSKLGRLSRYNIHSIEQPVKQGLWDAMKELCRKSPIPVALDEEMIGVNEKSAKEALLERLRPAYIVLKPSLHGGFSGTKEWVSIAASKGIASWMTSALESNVGLNAIAQWAAKLYGPDIKMAQGLGTGLLFKDNIPMPIEIRGNKLWRAE